jgi:hypothetical protein
MLEEDSEQFGTAKLAHVEYTVRKIMVPCIYGVPQQRVQEQL